MITQFSEQFEQGTLDTWVMSNHILNSLDHKFVSKQNLNELAWILQRSLISDYPSSFENLAVKNCMINKISGSTRQPFQDDFDEQSIVVDELQKYKHAMINTLKFAVEQNTLSNDDVSQQFLETYGKMTLLEQTIQNYYNIKGISDSDLELDDLQSILNNHKNSQTYNSNIMRNNYALSHEIAKIKSEDL